MIKSCLIIDNEDQSAEVERLITKGQRKGINIECDQFNVGSTFDDELLTNGKIDADKVVHAFRGRFKKKTFHLVAIDWELGDESCNGVELIRQFSTHRILKHTPKLLYSGLLEEKLSSMLDDYRNNKLSKQIMLNHIKTLIKIDIKDFVDRTDYDDDILRLLESTEESLDLIIEEELNKFPELKFSNSFSSNNFNGKTFLDIAQILETDDHLRYEFKREIIQQVIAYLTEII